MNECTFLICDERYRHFLHHFFHSLKVSFHEKDLLSEDVLSVFVGSPPPRSALEQEPEPGNAGRGLRHEQLVSVAPSGGHRQARCGAQGGLPTLAQIVDGAVRMRSQHA